MATRARATGRDDDDDDDASRGNDAAREKRKEFWREFWEVYDERTMNGPFVRVHRAKASEKKGKREARGDASASTRAVGKETFWGTCTIGGLILAVALAMSANALTHWPTCAYVATHPMTLVFNPFANDGAERVEIALEVIRRLGKPFVRFVAAWCAVRSRWRAMVVLFAASMAIPGVEFSV